MPKLKGNGPSQRGHSGAGCPNPGGDALGYKGSGSTGCPEDPSGRPPEDSGRVPQSKGGVAPGHGGYHRPGYPEDPPERPLNIWRSVLRSEGAVPGDTVGAGGRVTRRGRCKTAGPARVTAPQGPVTGGLGGAGYPERESTHFSFARGRFKTDRH